MEGWRWISAIVATIECPAKPHALTEVRRAGATARASGKSMTRAGTVESEKEREEAGER
jgi:hypothetical protein